MGDPDPIDFINLETQRLPFKQSQMDLDDWDGTFRSWPNKIDGWRDWFRRISAKKQADWSS
jgi:hypothetical protein